MNIEQTITYTTELEMLSILLDQDQFELLNPEEHISGGKLRLVYLMNDAVESFLVFTQAVLTGKYDPDYEGELEAYLNEEGEQYVLTVHQGENIVTVFFKELQKEVQLYNYGQVGHNWVKGYEYLRQLEYRLAILRHKRDFLGEEYCNQTELLLAELADFPPLNYCCYPAVPDKYLVPIAPAWSVTEEAIVVMEYYAKMCNDHSLFRKLHRYRKLPYPWMAKRIAICMHQEKHFQTIEAIMRSLEQAAADYPDRHFGKEDAVLEQLIRQAKKRQTELESQGYKVTLVREEPFTTSRDSIGFKVFLLIWKVQRGNVITEIETLE